jgi:hypothetical protein
MKRGISILMLLMVSLCFTSCDPIYVLNVNGNEELDIYFDCGRVTLKTATMGGIDYFLKQEYYLEEDVVINTKAPIIRFKNKTIEYRWFDEMGSPISEDYFKVDHKRVLTLEFLIRESIKKGDEIIITGNDFLVCKGKNISFNQLIITIDKDF